MKTFAACSTLALGLMALAPGSTAAQATVPIWRELVIYAADASYPDELARRGVQGEATIELRVADHGRKTAIVRDSSRSAELDALAVKMAHRLDIKGSGDASSGLIRFQFRKDSDTTIATKTCADFNVDAAYHATTFPEHSQRMLPGIYESVGKLVYSLHREGEQRSFPALESLMDATMAACARTPESGFLEVMRQEALKLIR